MIDAVLDRLTRLHPKVIDLSLERVVRLLDRLGNPQQRLPPVIHVAGTNGKGSTVATLRALFEAAGRRVHAYTSPHLVRFAERIRIAGMVPDDAAMLALLEEVEAANAGAPVTFFEITTAAAFLAFARTPAHMCLLETGLGGRLDATNVVERPAVTILTPIALDHQHFLGDTLAAIAGEKAAIMKPGAPCVVAAQSFEARDVILAQAARLGVTLVMAGRDFTATADGDGLVFADVSGTKHLPAPSLPGAFQIHNAGLALAALGCLTGPPLDESALAFGLRHIQWPARIQRLTRGPLVDLLPPGGELWLDGGHNPHAAQALAAHAAQAWRDRPLVAVMGMLNTKDIDGCLAPLAPVLAALRGVTIPGEANALPAEAVIAAALGQGIRDAAPAESVAAAVAEMAARPGPIRLVICGSLYLAGKILAENG